MNINDRDVRNAIETLIQEFENKEDEVKDLENSEEQLAKQVEELENRVAELEDKVKELEEALAEAYLTSEVNDEESSVSGEDVELPPGCGPNVSDSTSN